MSLLAQLAGQARCDHPQQLVADAMAVGVVDGLEAVEVEVEQGHFLGAALGGGQGLHQAVIEQGAVRQPGERILVGHLANGLLQEAAAGDLDQDAVDVFHPAVGALDGPGMVADPDHPAVQCAQFEFAESDRRGGQPLHVLLAGLLAHVQVLDVELLQVGKAAAAEHVDQRLVGLDDAPAGGGAVDADRQVLQQVLVAEFVLAPIPADRAAESGSERVDFFRPIITRDYTRIDRLITNVAGRITAGSRECCRPAPGAACSR